MPVCVWLPVLVHYDGIIDGLTRCCDWFGPPVTGLLMMVNDGLWVTGVVAVSWVGPGNLAVFTNLVERWVVL